MEAGVDVGGVEVRGMCDLHHFSRLGTAHHGSPKPSVECLKTNGSHQHRTKYIAIRDKLCSPILRSEVRGTVQDLAACECRCEVAYQAVYLFNTIFGGFIDLPFRQLWTSCVQFQCYELPIDSHDLLADAQSRFRSE